MRSRCLRRRAIHLLAAAGVVTTTAGCSGPGSLDELSLRATEMSVSSIQRLERHDYFQGSPVEIPVIPRVDFVIESLSSGV